MSKRTTFTTITPLPAGITRELALDFLRDHEGMIDLNPLVVERHAIDAPAHAPEDERLCRWWSMTDKITYMPGVKGELTYSAAFFDLANGLQTHVYAPMGTDIRERWTVGGTLPGEPLQPMELGLGAPRQGLYIREDVDLRCNFLMASFVRKTLSKAHTKVVENMTARARACLGGLDAAGDDAAPGMYPARWRDGGGDDGASSPDDQGAAARYEPSHVMSGYPGHHAAHRRNQSAAPRRYPHLPPVYGHRAAASETDLSPTILTPEPLTPSRASGHFGHAYQNSWESSAAAGQWPFPSSAADGPSAAAYNTEAPPQIPPIDQFNGYGTQNARTRTRRAGSYDPFAPRPGQQNPPQAVELP